MKRTKNNLPFDPNGQIFRWGPVPVKFLYVSTFVETHYKHFRAKYGDNWSETLWLFKGGRSLWINNTLDIQMAGQRVFIKYMLSKRLRRKIYQEWLKYVGYINAMEKKIDKLQLSKLGNADLLKLWNNFNDLYLKFWVTGSVPELANYGSDKYLANKLHAFIAGKDNLMAVMEVLTAPVRMSFYQEEEIELVKTKDLKKHQRMFFWLKNSYAGTQVLPVQFFAKRKKELNTNLKVEIQKSIADTLARKQSVQKQFKLPQEVMNVAEAVSDGIGWQDERKKYIFIILHYLDVMVREVASRFEYDYGQLHDIWYYQIAQIIEGKDMHTEIAKRNKGFGVRFFHDCKELSAKEMEYFWGVYETERVVAELAEVKGIVVSKGDGQAVRGKVHILFDPNKIEDFQKGEVLVAPMTSPEYVFVMKKASAIITDTGGLTSHAAIVSRELNIPCIVGAKIATKVLKDGDLIEMNVQNGVIKILDKAH